MVKYPKVQYLATISLLLVFIIDVVIPSYYIVDTLYICCIVITFKQKQEIIIGFTLSACVLIAINAVFFDLKNHQNISVWINRSISIFAILITSYIAIRYRKLYQASILKEQAHSKALEELLFMTSHQVRKPVANILGLIENIDADFAILSPADIYERCKYLQVSAIELDSVVKNLSAFIEHTSRQTFDNN